MFNFCVVFCRAEKVEKEEDEKVKTEVKKSDTSDEEEDDNEKDSGEEADVREVRYKLESLCSMSRQQLTKSKIDNSGASWLKHLRSDLAQKDKGLSVRNITWIFNPDSQLRCFLLRPLL